MKKIITSTFCIVLLLFSCAKEVDINIPEQNDPALKANSTLANLMQQTSLNDGSIDNIIDKASCFNITLPVTVIVNGEEIIIETEEDYEVVESIFDNDDNDEDTLEINFPVTIILSDFTEIIINNQDELESYIDDDCNDGIDDDIECVDFQYPINASTFNINTEQFIDVIINNDEDMHDFIEDLDEDITATIDFPITIILFDGTEITIDNLDQLETEIENAKNNCDEDDDNDFDDDDNISLSEQEFSDLMTSCTWTVDELEIDDQDLENFEDYIFTFNSDGTVSAELNGNSSNGTWNVSTDSGLRLNLLMDSLTEFDNSWRLHKIEEEDDGEIKVDLRIGADDQLKLIKNCN